MVDDVVLEPQHQAHSIFHRRISNSGDHLELLSIRPASQIYTSLRDLLPTVPVNSPTPQPLGSDICIRNRLVKQAAWAYLQPMSTSPGSAGDSFFHRLRSHVAAFLDLVRRAVDWTLRVLWIRSPRYQRVV